jgi:hypothetical protein
MSIELPGCGPFGAERTEQRCGLAYDWNGGMVVEPPEQSPW